ncbi:hypothetical protein AK812_SmicGene40790 [Symbiodinium microadriaticum]|uniref:Uncharacterized protein n=1 Tax=Symbiodinium microadriaticum TaxID=2951 RepID=A0A1Q9C7T1_SYMMI|nr:hypothetical protein AK812_SmicGene40790 [Symbiodinium microadriaticum]
MQLRGDYRKAILPSSFFRLQLYAGATAEAYEGTPSGSEPPLSSTTSDEGGSEGSTPSGLQQHHALGLREMRRGEFLPCTLRNTPRATCTNRPKSAPLLTKAKGAAEEPVILNRREVINQGPDLALPRAAPAEASPARCPLMRPPTSRATMSTSSRPISYAPVVFVIEPAQSLGTTTLRIPRLQLAAAPARTLPRRKQEVRCERHDHWPLSPIKLWFTTRDIDADTPRLVVPWSLFQYLAMSQRTLSGFQSWGRVGAVFIRRVAQDIIHGAQQRNFMDLIKEMNLSNPWLLDLWILITPNRWMGSQVWGSTSTQAKDRPGQVEAHFHASMIVHFMRCLLAEAEHASNCMGMWARRLGQETPSPPAKGAPPKTTSRTTPPAPTAAPAPDEAEEEEEESDMELTAEERAEVARIEEECAELERRMRNLSATQQPSLLENLANTSSAVMGGLLADTVKSIAQNGGQGQRSLPPMLSLGRSHRLSHLGTYGD